MDKATIINFITTTMIELLPELEGTEIDPKVSFSDYGLNSIDRADLIIQTVEEHQIQASMIEFAGATSADDLAEKILTLGGA